LAFNQVPRLLQPLAFFHIWSQKEALIKACGLGLTYPTQQFSVPILPSTNQEIIDTLHKTTWQMISFMPEIACSAALCYHSAINQIRYLKLTEAQEL
jgi:4'-phosphopantetheinyl transferase